MSRGTSQDGGLFVTPQMQEILDQPGFISIQMGSEKLRNMFQTQFGQFDPDNLSQFARACTFGDYDGIKQAITSGTAPDLTKKQTPFQLSFISLAVLGSKCLQPYSPEENPLRHADVLACLINAGAPVDVTDIVGHTALHHACTPPHGRPELAKLLLEKGANVNSQTRYGEVPLCFPFQGGDVKLIDLLMARGADLDIPDANGDTPRRMCLIFGAEVTAAVQRWERKRKGEVAPLQEIRCENCKTKGSGLRQCSRCHLVRYCSTECQRANWKEHKPNCRSFSTASTVTLKPTYTGPGALHTTISRADFMRETFGLATPGSSQTFRPGLTKKQKAEKKAKERDDDKGMVIKIQVPVSLSNEVSSLDSPFAALFIYNKKRDFVCTVKRSSDPKAYDAVAEVVKSRGVGGAKAYFAAELRAPNELVVNIAQVLAEQPF